MYFHLISLIANLNIRQVDIHVVLLHITCNIRFLHVSIFLLHVGAIRGKQFGTIIEYRPHLIRTLMSRQLLTTFENILK